MIYDDGYSVEYIAQKNMIIIRLPQTMDTLTSTTNPVAERRHLTEYGAAALLHLVKALLEKK